MKIRRSKRLETTLNMIEPGEVFEDCGYWYMKCSNEIDGSICAVSLANGYIQKYKNAEEYQVIAIPGEFVAKG